MSGPAVSGPFADPGRLLGRTVAEFLADVAAATPAPGGGGAAALSTALAAALTAMAGRFSQHGDPPEELVRLVERADELRERAGPLADADAAAYGRFLAALRLPREPDPEQRREAVRSARTEAVEVPLAAAAAATEITGLALGLVRSGNPNLRGDAAAAVLLGCAAAVTSAILVGENLAATPEDPRLEQAAEHARAARGAAEQVMELFPVLRRGAP